MKAKQAIIYLLTILMLTIACGRKTPPEAPEDRAPRPVMNLKVETNRNGIKLTWKAPTENVKGDELTALDSFNVYRREYQLAQSNKFKQVANIKIEKIEVYSFTDLKVEAGKTYDYLVSAISDEGVVGVQESFARITFKGSESTTTITPYIEEVQ